MFLVARLIREARRNLSSSAFFQAVTQMEASICPPVRKRALMKSCASVLVAATSPGVVTLFTTDPAVRSQAMAALLVVALVEPACGVVFVLDGVLMGAGDGPYLAWAMLGTLVVFLPAVRKKREEAFVEED